MIDDESLKNIEKLHQLKNDGIITDEDFEKGKQQILYGLRKATPAAPSMSGSGGTQTLKDDDWFGWMTLPIKRYAEFNGRSSRKEYWMFQLIYVAMTVAMFVIVGMDSNEYGEGGSIGKLTLALFILAFLGLAVPYVAVQVRRFHDQDKSGWFALLNLIPYIGPIVVLVFMAIEGTPGDNQFGPNPKQH